MEVRLILWGGPQEPGPPAPPPDPGAAPRATALRMWLQEEPWQRAPPSPLLCPRGRSLRDANWGEAGAVTVAAACEADEAGRGSRVVLAADGGPTPGVQLWREPSTWTAAPRSRRRRPPPTPNGRAQRQAGRGCTARQGPRPTEQQRRVSCGRGGGRAAQDSALRSKQTSNPWCPVSGDGVVRRPGRTETDYDICYTGRVS